jgi:hypothetical protein
MAYQTGSNVLVALKRESTFATAPVTVTGAVRLRTSRRLSVRYGQIFRQGACA